MKSCIVSIGYQRFYDHHKALVICAGRPAANRGTVSGYATFQDVHNHKEVIFSLVFMRIIGLPVYFISDFSTCVFALLSILLVVLR
ncbi:unnamed protein product [Gongylonema pulchrum]|uniref:Transmembrane protein n=1 Tax=Gongylonema pulchrum TaxID=637853 RepID=A0A183EVE1_9BILA|nr:unnamed protein product [Gongylonema pulchrum]